MCYDGQDLREMQKPHEACNKVGQLCESCSRGQEEIGKGTREGKDLQRKAWMTVTGTNSVTAHSDWIFQGHALINKRTSTNFLHEVRISHSICTAGRTIRVPQKAQNSILQLDTTYLDQARLPPPLQPRYGHSLLYSIHFSLFCVTKIRCSACWGTSAHHRAEAHCLWEPAQESSPLTCCTVFRHLRATQQRLWQPLGKCPQVYSLLLPNRNSTRRKRHPQKEWS